MLLETEIVTADRRRDAGRLKTLFERNAKALDLRSGLGRGTAVTKVRLADGLACDVEDGDWRLRVDMAPKAGGADSGPNPGVLGRASLGSCLAVNYARIAALTGLPVDSIEIEVQADYDSRYEYGMAGPNPGYRQVRCVVRVESPAPAAQVRGIFEQAHDLTTYLGVWRNPQDVQVRFDIHGAE
jgi:uncharacterized OsmC-like protein